eukprot:scaffold270276_cov23-Tisochrysis_lutea.AAC.1
MGSACTPQHVCFSTKAVCNSKVCKIPRSTALLVAGAYLMRMHCIGGSLTLYRCIERAAHRSLLNEGCALLLCLE